MAVVRRATIRATYAVRPSGKILVRLTSNAKVAQVRFRRAGVKRTVREPLRNGQGRVVLRRGAKAVSARALATRKLARSAWTRATKAVPRKRKPDSKPPLDAVRRRLAVAASRHVLFGHQSVGNNILEAVPAVYRAHGMSAPPILPPSVPAPDRGGYIVEASIGANAQPLLKIADFARLVRSRLGRRVDVALMKLCYIDVMGDTDVQEIFSRYRRTMAALAADHPRLVLVHVTTPLTTDSPEDNLARERLNALMRKQYGATGRLFDLAKVESTRPDGTRVTGTVDGERYFALYRGYASDSGHLNKVGGRRAATALLSSIAAARD